VITLLTKYNKVTNEAFANVSQFLNEVKETDLAQFGELMDVIPEQMLHNLLVKLLPFDNIIVGDIFWPTGQRICQWCDKHGKKAYFLQHGQWVYIKNKTNPACLPTATFVYGTKVRDMMAAWPYSSRSKVYVTGNPRYDDIEVQSGSYVYFCPPVIHERIPSKADQIHVKNQAWVTSFAGIDRHMDLLIHPHYREGAVKTLKKIFPNARFADPQADALPLIQKSSKVLTHRNSTTVIDAIACRKLSVLMNYGQYEKSFFHRGYFGEFAVEINSPRDVEDIGFLVVGDDYIKRAEPYICLEGASKKIKDIIEFGV